MGWAEVQSSLQNPSHSNLFSPKSVYLTNDNSLSEMRRATCNAAFLWLVVFFKLCRCTLLLVLPLNSDLWLHVWLSILQSLNNPTFCSDCPGNTWPDAGCHHALLHRGACGGGGVEVHHLYGRRTAAERQGGSGRRSLVHPRWSVQSLFWHRHALTCCYIRSKCASFLTHMWQTHMKAFSASTWWYK